MAKYFGKIGFADTIETVPGVWKDRIIEHEYYGDITRNMGSYRSNQSNELNENINVSNQISILADPYAFHNFQSIRYIEWMDTRWKVSRVEVQYPRLILELGGVYNGDTGPSSRIT